MHKKTWLNLALSLCLLAGLLSPAVSAWAAPNYAARISMGQQYTGNESYNTVEVFKEFNSASDMLGTAGVYGGLFNSARTTFAGWTDQPPVPAMNGSTNTGTDFAPGAKIFSEYDTIATAFPNGLTGNEKLYPVYLRIPIPDAGWGAISWVGGGNDLLKLGKFVNEDNKVTIAEGADRDSLLPNTKLAVTRDDGATIVDYYRPMDDNASRNEVVLHAGFTYDARMALVAYRNPTIGYGGHRVMSLNYKTDGGKALDSRVKYDDAGRKGSSYTYMDLNVQLDPDIQVPEKLYMTFSSYTWRPLYVLDTDDANRAAFQVFDPEDGTALGNDKNSFNTLVLPTTPDVTYAFETQGKRNFTVRVILRVDNIESVRGNDLPAGTPEMTRGDHIVNHTKLITHSSAELKAMFPDMTDAQIQNSILYIKDAKALEMARTDGNMLVVAKGTVDGIAKASAGIHNLPFFGPSELASITRIAPSPSNVLSFGYKMPPATPTPAPAATATLAPQATAAPRTTAPATPAPKVPKTGDATALPVLMAAASAAVVALGVGAKRKKEQ